MSQVYFSRVCKPINRSTKVRYKTSICAHGALWDFERKIVHNGELFGKRGEDSSLWIAKND